MFEWLSNAWVSIVQFLDVSKWFVLAGAVSVIMAAYMILGLAKANIFWTIVERGWCRIVLRVGNYKKTVGPGLHWIGIPGFSTLYSRRMTFFKSVTNEYGAAKAEPHDDWDVNRFKTTEYPYALPFKDEEDSHGLPLAGVLGVFAVIEDYRKAFFSVSDWYLKMNTTITEGWRNFLATVTYDDDVVGRGKEAEQNRKAIGDRFFEFLNRQSNGGQSILQELYAVAGIHVRSVGLVSVDPPANWREVTLAPYKAGREAEAAKAQAEASATMFGDTGTALQAWLTGQRAAGHNPTPAQISAKQAELYERALAKTPGWQQIHVRGLENSTTTVLGGGAGAGLLVGGGGPSKSRRNSSASGDSDVTAGKPIREMTDDEIRATPLAELGRRMKRGRGRDRD